MGRTLSRTDRQDFKAAGAVRGKLRAIANRSPEVMIKFVVGAPRGMRQIRPAVGYISKKGDIPLEEQDGLITRGGPTPVTKAEPKRKPTEANEKPADNKGRTSAKTESHGAPPPKAGDSAKTKPPAPKSAEDAKDREERERKSHETK